MHKTICAGCVATYIATFAVSLLCISPITTAQSVTLVGTFPNKALMVIGASNPRTLSVGETTAEGVKLVSATADSATVEIAGKRQVLGIGVTATRQSESSIGRAVLAKSALGHHFTTAQINGSAVQLMVDTGASTIALSAANAAQLKLNYRAGTRMRVSTANGVAEAWRVRLDSVKVGEITLYDVEAMVMEYGLTTGLLGNSFLSRTDMKTENGLLTLTKRF